MYKSTFLASALLLVGLFAAFGGGAPSTVSSAAPAVQFATGTPSPTATATPTVTPTDSAQSLLLVLPGFEATNGKPLTIDAAYPTLPSSRKSAGLAQPTSVPNSPPPSKPSAPSQEPTASSSGELTTVVYKNEFSSCDDFPAEDGTRGKFGCENGQYVMVPSDKGVRYVQVPGDYPEGVFHVVGSVIQQGSNPVEYGLFFELSADNDQGYSFSVRTDGTYSISRIKEGNFEDIVPYTESQFVKSESNSIGVASQDGKLAFLLNDEVVNSVYDAPSTGGGLAMFVYSSGGGYSVGFDKVGIAKLNRAIAFPTPQGAPSGSPSQPTEEKPTPVPPPPTEPPPPTPESGGDSGGCTLAQGESGLIISNSYEAPINLAIGGGAWGMHEYEIPPDGERYLVTFPAGRYTFTATIVGLGSDEGEPYDYLEGTCREISYGP